MKGLYNSALKNGTVQILDVEPTFRFTSTIGVGMKHNILDPLPEDFADCDVVYCEPPFPAGIKVFNDRANENTDYNDFCKAFAGMVSAASVPVYAITNKRLMKYLPEPTRTVSVKLNGANETLSSWGGVEIPNGLTNLEVCSFLGRHYRCIGDLTCGYGIPVMEFIKARVGNKFVASDYDARCITVLKGLVEKHENIS